MYLLYVKIQRVTVNMQNHTFQTLYGTDNVDNIRQWTMKVVEYPTYSEMIITHGVLNCKHIETIIKVEKGKNIGKKNETTHYQQALSEATSKWKKKKDIERYTTDLNSLNIIETKDSKKAKALRESNPLMESFLRTFEAFELNSPKKKGAPKPMLAHEFKKFQSKLTFPCYIQKKYDGYRMLYDPETDNLYTRTGRKYDILYETELHKQLRQIKLPLDGELYCHKDFNFECYGVLRRKRAKGKDVELLDKIEFHVYDLHDSKDTYKCRLDTLNQLTDKYSKIKIVETYECNGLEDIDNYHKKFVNDNYEGSIVRNAGSLYEVKRSFNLLKYKDFDDDEFEITGFTTEKDNDIELVIWICKTPDNKYFNVRPQGSKEERRELHKNAKKYINKKLWLKFFSYTEGGVPRFPTTNRNTYKEYIRESIE
jgi:ATP-dependent DNA ligase